MKRLHDAAAVIRGALLCQSSNQRTARAAQKLDPILRDALATTLQENNCQVELEELETELNQSKVSLEQAVKKEQFLGLRSRHYRQVLDTTARTLHQERVELKTKDPSSSRKTNERDEEADAVFKRSLLDWEKRMEKWEKDQDALKAIQTTHTQILATIEEMRRTIRKLEQKKATVQKLSDQCQEFVSAAATTAVITSNSRPDCHDEAADMELTQGISTEATTPDGNTAGEVANEGDVEAENVPVVESPLSQSLANDSLPETMMENVGAVDTAEQVR